MYHAWGRTWIHAIFLDGKREETRPLGINKLRWEDNIKIDLQEIE
jgi:hypothetical protein